MLEIIILILVLVDIGITIHLNKRAPDKEEGDTDMFIPFVKDHFMKEKAQFISPVDVKDEFKKSKNIDEFLEKLNEED